MAEASAEPSGPDLAEGVALDGLADGGRLVGHAGGKPILLVRRGKEVFAVAAHCTHYNGPLGDGLVVGNTVRCPWHHACFDLRTGEALRAPALSPVACWRVEQQDGKIFVREKVRQQKPEPRGKPAASAPDRIVIVGGGAAGFAAAEMLRRVHYQGSIVMLDMAGGVGPPDQCDNSADEGDQQHKSCRIEPIRLAIPILSLSNHSTPPHANGRGHNTSAALSIALPKLKEEGYSFVTVSELIDAGDLRLEP